MDRIKNGFRLVQASWDVLRADREMLLLPILSLLSSLGLIGLVLVGLFLDDLSVIRDTGIAPTPTAFEYVVMALVTYLLSYITIFFNVALVCAADERMKGGDPTLRGALSDAWRHAAAIAPWAGLPPASRAAATAPGLSSARRSYISRGLHGHAMVPLSSRQTQVAIGVGQYMTDGSHAPWGSR